MTAITIILAMILLLAGPLAAKPDNTVLWQDETDYKKTYYVSKDHPNASDDNPGTSDQPFATISKAAGVLRPGEKVVIGKGVYRETVSPARGGLSKSKMIAYEAASGEEVVVSGAEKWQPEVKKSGGWHKLYPKDGTQVWMADLPRDWFTGYNPFLANDMCQGLTDYGDYKDPTLLKKLQRRRGMVFYEDIPLSQVFHPKELAEASGAFWVEEPGLRLHFRLPEDKTPNNPTFEVTVREQAFSPNDYGCNYIRVSGIQFTKCADGAGLPQRSMFTSNRGHHWIITDCEFSHAHATAINIGFQDWQGKLPEINGCHIIRNSHIHHCGVSGISGLMGVHDTIIEGNTIEHIGSLDIERTYECAAIKFHVPKNVRIRNNIFRHVKNACAVWFDMSAENCRVSQNIFYDIESVIGAVFVEICPGPNSIDHNVFWQITAPADEKTPYGPVAVNIDSSEKATVANNLFAHVHNAGNTSTGTAVACHLLQNNRVIDGRNGLARECKIMENVFYECPRSILFAHVADNTSDRNIFDRRYDACAFTVESPAPPQNMDLAAWQEYFGMDKSANLADIECEFDQKTMDISCVVDGEKRDLSYYK